MMDWINVASMFGFFVFGFAMCRFLYRREIRVGHTLIVTADRKVRMRMEVDL